MPGKCRLIPRVAATGAIRDVLSSVQECSWKTAVAAALQIDHGIRVLTGVAVQKEPGTGGAPLLASLCIYREPLAQRRVADGKIEPVAEPNTERPIRPASPLVVPAGPFLGRFNLGRGAGALSWRGPPKIGSNHSALTRILPSRA